MDNELDSLMASLTAAEADGFAEFKRHTDSWAAMVDKLLPGLAQAFRDARPGSARRKKLIDLIGRLMVERSIKGSRTCS